MRVVVARRKLLLGRVLCPHTAIAILIGGLGRHAAIPHTANLVLRLGGVAPRRSGKSPLPRTDTATALDDLALDNNAAVFLDPLHGPP